MFNKELVKRFFTCANCEHSTQGGACQRLNGPIDYEGKCPLGLWEGVFILGLTKIEYDPDSHTLWLPREDKVVEAQLDAKYERVPGYLRWKLGSESWFGKAKEALGSIISGRLADDDPVVALRRKQCFGGDGQQRCSALSVEGDGAWCKACSCGKALIANIDGSQSKLTFRTLNCPRRMPGFSNGGPG